MKKKMVLDKVFVRLAVLVTIPLMVMGMISWMTYIRQESEKNNMTVELYTEEISGEYEQLLSMIKRYYMEFSASEGFRRLIQQKAIPYHMPAQLREAQNGMKGNSLIDGFVEDYEFLNLSQGWILDNYGLFPYGDLKNKEQPRNQSCSEGIQKRAIPPKKQTVN